MKPPISTLGAPFWVTADNLVVERWTLQAATHHVMVETLAAARVELDLYILLGSVQVFSATLDRGELSDVVGMKRSISSKKRDFR